MNTLFFLSMAVASFSMTLTLSPVFASLRGWIDDKSSFLGDLIHCPYCTSHYVSLLVVIMFGPMVATSGFYAADVIVSAFAMVTASSFFCGVIYYSLSGLNKEMEN